jgi:hypothetical protein
MTPSAPVGSKREGIGERTPCACGCGRLIYPFDGWKRPRFYARGHYLRVASVIYRTNKVVSDAEDAVHVQTVN